MRKSHQRIIRERDAYNGQDASLDDYSVRPISNRDAATFLRPHEYLGTPGRPQAAYGLFNGVILSGAITFGSPVAKPLPFGHIVLERGACASWCHPHAGSWFISRACRMAAEAHGWQIFMAFCDPAAGEIGSLYQAAGWLYIGPDMNRTVRGVPRARDKFKRGDTIISDRAFYKRGLTIADVHSGEWQRVPTPPKLRYVWSPDRRLLRQFESFPYPKRSPCPEDTLDLNREFACRSESGSALSRTEGPCETGDNPHGVDAPTKGTDTMDTSQTTDATPVAPTPRAGSTKNLTEAQRKAQRKIAAKAKAKAAMEAEAKRKAKADADVVKAGKLIAELAGKIREQEKVAVDAIKSAEKPLTKADSWRQQLIAELQKVRPVCKAAGMKFADFKAKYVGDLIGRTQLYQYLQIASGKTTFEEIRLLERDKKRDQAAAKAAEPTPTPEPVTGNGPQACEECGRSDGSHEPTCLHNPHADEEPTPFERNVEAQTGIAPDEQRRLIALTKMTPAERNQTMALREFKVACETYLPKLKTLEQFNEAEKIFKGVIESLCQKEAA